MIICKVRTKKTKLIFAPHTLLEKLRFPWLIKEGQKMLLKKAESYSLSTVTNAHYYHLTSPFSDEGIDVHQCQKNLRRLMEPWLVPIKTDHQGSLQSLE